MAFLNCCFSSKCGSTNICESLWINVFRGPTRRPLTTTLAWPLILRNDRISSLAISNSEKAGEKLRNWLVFRLSLCACEALRRPTANRGVAVSEPGLLGGPHASLHPCRMCRWWARLAQNRLREPQPREPGRQASSEQGERQKLPKTKNWNHPF